MFEIRKISGEESMLVVQDAITGENASEFHRLMQELCDSDTSIVTLNLSGATAINSSALGKIMLFRRKLEEGQRRLQIRGCSEILFKTFQMIKFDTLISIQR
jgi:anti-anti-sigma regulatory factor